MDGQKPDNSTEVRHLASIILSSVVLFFIFSAVWVVKKIKEGSL